MANSSTPFGFMPYGRLNGGSPTEELEAIAISSADTSMHFTGDLVCRSSTGGTLMMSSQAGIGMEDGTNVPAGVFWGCKFFSPTAGRTVWSRYFDGTAVSGAVAYVISDPNVLFRCVAATTAAGTTFPAADIGWNMNILSSQSSQGNTVTGQSVQFLSTATAINNSSANVRVLDLLSNRAIAGTPGTDNTSPFNQVIVAPNYWTTRAGTVTTST